MNLVERGSQTAKDGFKNEDDIVIKLISCIRLLRLTRSYTQALHFVSKESLRFKILLKSATLFKIIS